MLRRTTGLTAEKERKNRKEKCEEFSTANYYWAIK
jgi:hypothetical protein